MTDNLVPKLVHLIPRVVVAFILAQTLFFKFTGAEESRELFAILGMEPWGRIGIGIIELISVIFLLSRFYIIGAIISLSIISTANFLHFTKLGIVVNDDGGALFTMSIIVIVMSLWLVYYWNSMRSKDKQTTFENYVIPEEDEDWPEE